MSMLEIPEDTDISGMEEAIRVFVRIRPLNKRELEQKQTIGWNYNETSMIEETPNGQRMYAYDHCFGPTATNMETYEIVGKPVVLKAMEGYNGTVFTYGQTGSGKTWTMRGCESDPGMMVLCVRDILDWVKNHADTSYKIKICYLEVYNEEINDLLGEQGPASKNLKIVSEDAVRGAVIGGLVEESAVTAEDFMAILQRGEAARSYASTNMNAESSRSHTIYRVSIEAKVKNSFDEEGEESSSAGRVSYLNLVDLAGSERPKLTKATGQILKEGANINKSLLALGAVINKLGEACKKGKGGKPFIPYRDSKLTRILKQSLGGNTLTSILCAVTPAPMHREETVSTLKFGQTCKSIKNNVKSNDGVLDDKALIKQLRAQVAQLQTQVEEQAEGRKAGDADSTEVLHEMEEKVQILTTMLLGQGVNQADIQAALHTIGNATDSSDGQTATGKGDVGFYTAEIAKLHDKISEQQKVVTKLQRKLGEYNDLEELKASLEEYEHNLHKEMDDERLKLEEEKQSLQIERHKLLKDRTNIDEKESRIGILITNLDEKESKLRQLMATMREQQEQWQRSITDLQRREDLVDDWQRNHKQREKKLMEIEHMQEKKFAELNKREALVLEDENKAKQINKELTEREQRLQISLSRIANTEVVNSQKEEQLNQLEASVKKRTHDCDIRERELLSRRKELESWDVLLREKDRKIAHDQRDLDDRETSIQQLEEKNKSKEVENERKAMELKQEEYNLIELTTKYEKLNEELEEKEKDLKERDREYHVLRKELTSREEHLNKWEKHLLKLQEQMKGIESREKQLKQSEEAFKAKEDEFYNVKVAQIAARHNQDLKNFQETIQRQLKIAADFQKEIEAARSEVTMKNQQIMDLQELAEQRRILAEQLKEQLANIENNGGNILSNNLSTNGTATMSEGGGTANGTVSTSAGGNLLSPSQGEGNNMTNGTNAMNGNTTNAGGVSSAPPNANATQSSFFVDETSMAGSLQSPPPLPIPQFSPNSGLLSSRHPLLAGAPVPDFISQLALTRNMLYQVLERYDALPDNKSPASRRLIRSPQHPPQIQNPQSSTSQQQAMQSAEALKKSDEFLSTATGDGMVNFANQGAAGVGAERRTAKRRNNIVSEFSNMDDFEAATPPPPPPPLPQSNNNAAMYSGSNAAGMNYRPPAQSQPPYPSQGGPHYSAMGLVFNDVPHPPQLVAELNHPSRRMGQLATSPPPPPSSSYGMNSRAVAEEKVHSPIAPMMHLSSATSPYHLVPPSKPQGIRILTSPTTSTGGGGGVISSTIKRGTSKGMAASPVPASANTPGGGIMRSPISQKPAGLPNTPIAKKTPTTSNTNTALFGKELVGIVSAGEVDDHGVPITVVNLNRRAGIKKYVQGMH